MDVLKTTSRLSHLRDDVVGGPRDDLGRGAATHAVILTLACHWLSLLRDLYSNLAIVAVIVLLQLQRHPRLL
jgi:hypothetical protein